MGSKSSKQQSDADTRSPLPIDLYLLQEFQAMDKDNKGRLNLRQFTNLLLYLGFYQPADKIRRKLVAFASHGDGLLTETEYVNLMKNDRELLHGTRLLREMFKKFDGNNSGYALKSKIIQNLKDMGIYSAKMGKKIEAMDTNKDGNISYKHFLAIYFQGKWWIKKKSVFDVMLMKSLYV